MVLSERELLASVPAKLFIGGEWVAASGAKTFDVTDPSTGSVIATIADASPEDGMLALDAAAGAQDAWAATAPRVRGEILRKAFELVRAHSEELALLMTLEMGKPLAEARGEVTYGGEFCAGSARRRCASPAATASTPRGRGA